MQLLDVVPNPAGDPFSPRSTENVVPAAFRTAIRSMPWLLAAPMPRSKSRDMTQPVDAVIVGVFGIDADPLADVLFASVSQERPVFASFILCMVAERGRSTRRRVQKP